MSQESKASSIDLENSSIRLEQTKAQAGDTCLKDALEVITLLDSLLNNDEKLDIEMERMLSETIYTVDEEITATSECKT